MWLKLLKKFFKALNYGASPAEISAGVVFGAVLGITPFFALHNLLVILLVFIVKVNLSAVIFASVLFGMIGYASDPIAGVIGEKLLMAENLEAFWAAAYNTPVLAFARLNNTVILGSLVLALVTAPALFIFSSKFVVYYREHLQEKVYKLKVIKILKASKVYKLYSKVKGFKP